MYKHHFTLYTGFYSICPDLSTSFKEIDMCFSRFQWLFATKHMIFCKNQSSSFLKMYNFFTLALSSGLLIHCWYCLSHHSCFSSVCTKIDGHNLKDSCSGGFPKTVRTIPCVLTFDIVSEKEIFKIWSTLRGKINPLVEWSFSGRPRNDLNSKNELRDV